VKPEDIKFATDQFPARHFLVTPHHEGLEVVVDTDLVYRVVGVAPRRVNFASQNDYHDAYYQWQDKCKVFSTELLDKLRSKISGKFELRVNAWNKPSFILKNLFTT
jgi:hypothetical protein